MACMRSITALVLFTAVGAGALESGNLAYLPFIRSLPHLGKDEPAAVLQAAAGRRLLKDDSHSIGKDWRTSAVSSASNAVFAQGVASGDPYDSSVILWTRITLPANQSIQHAGVQWAVSGLKDFTKVSASGVAFTSPEVDFTVKVEATKLKPNTKYYYRFRFTSGKGAKPVYSVIGTTRTLPRPSDDISRVRIAQFGCSNLPFGYFTAYGQIARDADAGKIDFNIHTGDYIYEYADAGFGTTLRPHVPPREIISLQDYRERHTQYNSDVDTKDMRRSAPLIPIWDDHEYADNAWMDGALNHQPATEGPWSVRKLNALTAYYEQMPIRQVDADNKLRIYRDFQIGKLARLIMLDTRIIGRDLQNGSDAAVADPNRHLLGEPQKEYLFNTLDDANNKGQIWKIIGQQVLFSSICDIVPNDGDRWDGYLKDRSDVIDHLADNKINDTIILSGDIHIHLALDVAKYACPNKPGFNYNPVTGANSVAVEFVSSSITSGYDPSAKNQATQAATRPALMAAIPNLKYFEGFYKGYAILDITPTEAVNTWYFAPNLTVPGQYDNKVQGESWKVVRGSNRLVEAALDDVVTQPIV